MRSCRRGALIVLLCMLSACSSAKPVLYPNAYLKTVGKEVAEQDIAACRELAESSGAEEGAGKAGRVAGSTAAGAGIGAAAGAVGGALSGAAGHGSAIGAVTGAVWGFFSGLFHAAFGPSHPPTAYTNFVNRCLQEKGYEVTGWQ